MKIATFASFVSLATAFHFHTGVHGWGVPTSALVVKIVTRSTHLLMADLSNEEIMEGWVEDMIYSGDMQSYVSRYGKDVLCEEFVSYLHSRMTEVNDKDEKASLKEVLAAIQGGFASTDGMGGDSGVVFENRLNQILFTAPNQRRLFIEENLENMTPGFVEYIQEELRTIADSDSKVVIASILKLLGEVKGADLLGGASAMLDFADASLGDDFKKEDRMAELIESTKGQNVGDRNERILAALTFSSRDILEDILNNLHEIDDIFVDYLDSKVANTEDIEERVALGSLRDTVKTVLEKVSEVEGSGEFVDTGTSMEESDELDMNTVKQRMLEIQTGREFEEGEWQFASPVAAAMSFEVQADKRQSFLQILSRFTERPVQMPLEEAVRLNYDLCDYEFMEMLKDEITTCLNEGADIKAEQYQEIMQEITKTMAVHVGTAQERLQTILTKGHPKAMESEIVVMARRNEIDEALILLMEANMQQALAAGPRGVTAAKVLRALVDRANQENERKLPDEQQLLRALLRVDESEKRKTLIYEAFRQQNRLNDDKEMVMCEPLIKPPMFIRVVRSLITSFGNVDSFNIMKRANVIIEEAQEVATDLYGEGMTPRQQQKYMYDKQTVSVWDLGNYEDQATMSGEDVPWGNDAYNDKMPEEVLAEQIKKQMGGTGIGVTGDPSAGDGGLGGLPGF